MHDVCAAVRYNGLSGAGFITGEKIQIDFPLKIVEKSCKKAIWRMLIKSPNGLRARLCVCVLITTQVILLSQPQRLKCSFLKTMIWSEDTGLFAGLYSGSETCKTKSIKLTWSTFSERALLKVNHSVSDARFLPFSLFSWVSLWVFSALCQSHPWSLVLLTLILLF